jgi:hypothetical protein
VKGWALELIALTRSELQAFGARLEPEQRAAHGELRRWSVKDELGHLEFWVNTFSDNIAAKLEGRALKDIRDYQALNDQAWFERQRWTWTQLETALTETWARLETQVQALESAQFTDAAVFTLEPPKPLVRTLLYEVVDHPLHHLVRLYLKTDQGQRVPDLLERVQGRLARRGMAVWARSSRAKLRKHAARLEKGAGLGG